MLITFSFCLLLAQYKLDLSDIMTNAGLADLHKIKLV